MACCPGCTFRSWAKLSHARKDLNYQGYQKFSTERNIALVSRYELRIFYFDFMASAAVTPPFGEEAQLINNNIILPARVSLHLKHRGRNEYLYPEDDLTGYAQHELSVEPLNIIVDWLWFAGIPNNNRPLHRHLALGRRIVLTEDIDLHLLWRPDEIFIKPLPTFLINYNAYERFIVGSGNEDLEAAALGFLDSYVKLIVHESDLQIACNLGLVPKKIAYKEWTAFCVQIVKSIQTRRIAPRYHYGELRLARINCVYRFAWRFFPRHLTYGYYTHMIRYSSFISSSFRWQLMVVVYVSVVLNAFQVGLAAKSSLVVNPHFSMAAWVVVVLCLAFVLTSLAMIAILVGPVSLLNLMYALKMRKARVPPQAMA